MCDLPFTAAAFVTSDGATARLNATSSNVGPIAVDILLVDLLTNIVCHSNRRMSFKTTPLFRKQLLIRIYEYTFIWWRQIFNKYPKRWTEYTSEKCQSIRVSTTTWTRHIHNYMNTHTENYENKVGFIKLELFSLRDSIQLQHTHVYMWVYIRDV